MEDQNQKNYGFLLFILSIILIALWFLVYLVIYPYSVDQLGTIIINLLKSLIPNFINTLLAYVVIYVFLTTRNITLQRILDVIKSSPPRKRLISSIQKKLSKLEGEGNEVTKLLTNPNSLIYPMIENQIHYCFALPKSNQELIIHMSEIISKLDPSLAEEILAIERLIAKKDPAIAQILDDEVTYIRELVKQRNNNIRRLSSIHILYATHLTLKYYIEGHGDDWIRSENQLSLQESARRPYIRRIIIFDSASILSEKFRESLKKIYDSLKDSSSEPCALYLLSIDEIKSEGFSPLLSDFGIFLEKERERPVAGFFSYDPFFELTPFSKESRRQIVIKDFDYLERLYNIFNECWNRRTLRARSEENISCFIDENN